MSSPREDPALRSSSSSSLDEEEDLRRRLQHTRWVRHVDPDRVGAAAGSLGVSTSRVAEVLAAWTGYDWQAAKAHLLALPWVTSGPADTAVRAIHRPVPPASPPAAGTVAGTVTAADLARTAGQVAVVLLHGWPDSVLRYVPVLPFLDDLPLVVPALPGFPFSAPAPAGEFSGYTDVVDRLDSLVAECGYNRVVISAGDIGAVVAGHWAQRHPDRVAALHLTDVPVEHLQAHSGHARDAGSAGDAGEEGPMAEFLRMTQEWLVSEGTYLLQQRAKPNTLAVGLGDSPAGLAAWLLEKYDAWADEGLPTETVLEWLSSYWFTATIGSSFAAYATEVPCAGEAWAAPTVVSAFAADPAAAPRSVVSAFLPAVCWRPHPHGGHWPSLERPQDYVADLRLALAHAHR